MELVCHSQEALGEDEKKDYLYAVVDKANKKKSPPQVNITEMLFCLVVCAVPCFFKFLLAILTPKDLLSLDLSVTTIISCSLKINPKSRGLFK